MPGDAPEAKVDLLREDQVRVAEDLVGITSDYIAVGETKAVTQDELDRGPSGLVNMNEADHRIAANIFFQIVPKPTDSCRSATM